MGQLDFDLFQNCLLCHRWDVLFKFLTDHNVIYGKIISKLIINQVVRRCAEVHVKCILVEVSHDASFDNKGQGICIDWPNNGQYFYMHIKSFHWSWNVDSDKRYPRIVDVHYSMKPLRSNNKIKKLRDLEVLIK